MSIDIKKYIDITSVALGASTVPAPRLSLRAWVINELVAPGQVLTFTDAATLAKRLRVNTSAVPGQAGFGGTGIMIYKRALDYFSYVDENGNSPPYIDVAGFAQSARNQKVFGDNTIALSLPALQAITTGTLVLVQNNVAFTVGAINFATAATFADVATLLQARIRAAQPVQFPAVTVNYVAANSAGNGYFAFDSGSTTNQQITMPPSFSSTATIAATLGLSSAQATISTIGSAAETLVAAIDRCNEVNANWLNGIVTDDYLTDVAYQPTNADLFDVAAWIGSKQAYYQFTIPINGRDKTLTDANLYLGYSGINLIYQPSYPAFGSNSARIQYEDIVEGVLSASSNYASGFKVQKNHMYRKIGFLQPTISDTSTSSNFDAKRVNYYGVTQISGQYISFWQRGILCGGASANTDPAVYAGEVWLRRTIQGVLLSAQTSLTQIPPTAGGVSILDQLVRTQVIGGAFDVGTAIYNGTVQVGREGINAAQKIAIANFTGDANAWRSVQSFGFYLKWTIIAAANPDSGVQEYTANYILSYAGAQSVRTIKGAHGII